MSPRSKVEADPSQQRRKPGGRFNGKRILVVVNVDWFFLSHRLPLARAALAEGAEVIVATADTGRTELIRREGMTHVPIPMSRVGLSPVAEFRSGYNLALLYRRLRPDLIHHVTIKPVVYGSLAARLAPGASVVNAITGLGYAFSENLRAKAMLPLVGRLYRAALGHPRSFTTFQNSDDRDHFVTRKMISPQRAVLVPGDGVDCGEFAPGPPPTGKPVVLLAARLLWDKGVGEFVEAARSLRASGSDARFVLAGSADDDNPTAVSRAQLERWAAEGVIEWWGHRTDMPEVLRSCTLVALPTRYPEGVPKALIEAAATGLPLVATDTPGCRDIVRDGENGLLIPRGDATALAGAIERLLNDRELRVRFGTRGRRLVQERFAVEIVVERTMELYDRLLGTAAGGKRGDTGERGAVASAPDVMKGG